MAVRPLGERRWPEVARPVLVVPVGACEQHGPHLPLDTDTIIATELCRRVVAVTTVGEQIAVTPPIGIGASGEHVGFPGTLSIGVEALATVLIELVRSADWAAGVLFVNGHGGNLDALRTAVGRCHADGRTAVAAWSPSMSVAVNALSDAVIPPGDLHAGHIETSAMLYLRPELVAAERAAPGATADLITLRRDGVAAVAPHGVLGDPTAASAEHGARIIAAWAADLSATIAQQLARWS